MIHSTNSTFDMFSSIITDSDTKTARRAKRRSTWLNWFLGAFLVLFPLINSFLGIDIGDTGLHYTNFYYLYSRPDMVGYSTVLTSIVGNLWLNLFGGLGIWGLNLLEVFNEWLICIIAFIWLRKYYKSTVVLFGLVLASLGAGTYLNVFNYHQFTVLLVLCFLFFLHTGLTKDSLVFTGLSGMFLALAVAARISSLVCISAFILIFYFAQAHDNRIRFIAKHILIAVCSLLFGLGCLFAFLALSGLLEPFINSVFLLQDMASANTGSYSMSSIVLNLFDGTSRTLASPLLLCGAAFMFAIAIHNFAERKVFNFFLSAASLVVSVSLVHFSYVVNPVDGSPQMTTGPNFLLGVLLFTSIVRLWQTKNSRAVFGQTIMAIFLTVFVITGSNTGTKHMAISMWLMAPIFVFEIGELWTILIKKKQYEHICLRKIEAVLLVAFIVICPAYKYCKFIAATNNFDSTNRLELVHSVDSDNAKLMFTTEREAATLNGLIHAYQTIQGTEKLIVFGTGLGLYPLLQSEPFDRAWITSTSYSNKRFSENIINSGACPPVVFCRTNQYFGYGIQNYETLLESVKNNGFGGKKDLLKQFLLSNRYAEVYCDDYYVLFALQDDNQVSPDRLNDILG